MDMSRQIVHDLRRNYKIIKAQLDGVSGEDVQVPPHFGQHFGWNLGYIVYIRGRMIALLGIEPLWDEAGYERYAAYDRLLMIAEPGLALHEVVTDLTNAQEHLLAQIKRMANIDFDATPAGQDRPLGPQLRDLVWLETYHAGQMAGLRQLADANDS